MNPYLALLLAVVVGIVVIACCVVLFKFALGLVTTAIGWVFKAIWFVVTLPFRGIAALFRRLFM